MDQSLIAPCGINCALCLAYQRTKNNCPGCNNVSSIRPDHVRRCVIINCEQRKDGACSGDCTEYPCRRLQSLEKRYRTKYGVHIFSNLETIKAKGVESLLRLEKKKWRCASCREVLCMHRAHCLQCGEANPHFSGSKK